MWGKYGCVNLYICALVVYLAKTILLTLKISRHISIGAPGHGKCVLDCLNTRDGCYLRGEMNRLLNNLTTTCGSIGVPSFAYSRSVVDCSYLKYIYFNRGFTYFR